MTDIKIHKMSTTNALEVIFVDENLESMDCHGQLKCKNLHFPFAKDDRRPTACPLKEATTLVEADRLTGVKKIMELSFDTKNADLAVYAPGDTLAILPQNTSEDVEFLLQAMQLTDKADQICEIRSNPLYNKKKMQISHLPEITTPREILRDVLNLRAVLKKQFLRNLAEYCKPTATDEREFLNRLASKEGTKLYNELILEKSLKLCDILGICPTCQPTLEFLGEHLPRLLPRPYSIANSPITHDDEVKIIFSILCEKAGVTTSMLEEKSNNLKPENRPRILLYPRQPNNFRYTNDDFDRNQILIAIGTGVAPFIGFLEHKAALLSKSKSSRNPGCTWLFVGAPTPAAVVHRKRLLAYQKEHSVLQRYFESFSRVDNTNFHYIQDQLMANANELIEFLLNPKTTLFVCADGATISKSIEAALAECLQQQLQLPTVDEAKQMLKEFRSTGKYCEDLWT